jgi:putative membrane protein
MSRPASSRAACLLLGAALFLGTTSASFAVSDYEFLKNAIRGSESEVFLGRLAATNASRGDVKSFGQMLVDDHSKARDEATGLVQQMGMIATNAPNSEAGEERETLKQLKGEAFDKEFVRYMIEDHKKDIAAFRREASARPGPAKDFASRTLPTLQKHLDTAEGLASR